MKITIVSGWDPEDPRAWSGAVRPMVRALEHAARHRGHELSVWVLRVPDHLVDRLLARLHGAMGRGYLPHHALATVFRLGARLRRDLRSGRVPGGTPDVVVGIAASGELALARLQAPVVQITDATFSAVRELYPMFQALGPMSRWQAECVERANQRNSAAHVVASSWARDSCLRDYGTPPEHVVVAPFGPAIEPERASDPSVPPHGTVPSVDGADPEEPLRLLTVAGDWYRKGGDRAVAAVAELRRNGVPAELTVVGNAPAGLPDWVRAPGVLDRAGMADAYAQHDVLLELTRGAAGGITLSDAAAFGLPSVAQRTGGVAEVVEQGRTGYLVEDECQAVAALTRLADAGIRRRMGRAARQRHDEVLSWDRWAALALPVIERAGQVGP